MKITLIFTLLTIVLLFCNCDAPGLVVEMDPHLELVTPEREAAQEYCCIDFKWESGSALPDHNFLLSTDAAFDSIIIDTSGLVGFFQLDLNLGSDKTYYWKVTCISTGLERISSFKIINYISKYEGVYSATYYERSWNGLEGVTLDTSYTGQITITDSELDDHLYMEYESSTRKKAFDYRIIPEITTEGNIHFLDDVEEFPKLKIIGNLDVVQDSLVFFYHSWPGLSDYQLRIEADLN